MTEGGASQITIKITRSIYEEVCKYQTDNQIASVREAFDKLIMTKLALPALQNGLLEKEDSKLSIYELAIKHIAKADNINVLIKSASLKKREKEIELLELKIKKLKDGAIEIKYVDKFICPACNEVFSSADLAVRHFNEKHPAPAPVVETETERVFGCPFCEHVASSQGSLSAHLLTLHRDRFNPPPSPISRPIPASPPIVQEKIVYQDRLVEVKKYACFCGFTCQTQEQLGFHFPKCEKMKKVQEVLSK